jgi:hypothetical protein
MPDPQNKTGLRPRYIESDDENDYVEEDFIPPHINSNDFLGQVTGVPTPGFDRAAMLEEALQRIVKVSAQPITDTNARQRMRIIAAEALAK